MQLLGEAEYISLATFRKSGKEVATPVWAAAIDDALYVFSESKAGKVKRLRNSSRSKVAECTARGKPLGAWFEATSTLVDAPEEIEAAYSALRKKYGWKMWVLDLGSKMAGKYNKRAIIKIVIDETA